METALWCTGLVATFVVVAAAMIAYWSDRIERLKAQNELLTRKLAQKKAQLATLLTKVVLRGD